MKTRKMWSEEELTKLVGYAERGYNIIEISDLLNRSVHSVQNRLARYALEKRFPDIKWQASNDVKSDLSFENQ